MKWIRRFVGLVAIVLLVIWMVSLATFGICFASRGLVAGTCRQGVTVCFLNNPPLTWSIFNDPKIETDTVGNDFVVDTDGYWQWPRTFIIWSSRVIQIPHWLPNLIVWSLFLILWLCRRRYPIGHCQSCGYDLTGNESGKCPECNRAVLDSIRD